jgi:hypothetical protein
MIDEKRRTPPGIYEGVDFKTYCDWDAINHSKLCRIDKSPLNTQHGMDFSKSKAVAFGSLMHCGQLEPNSLADRYCVMPKFHCDPENAITKGKTVVRSYSASSTYAKTKRAEFTEEAATEGREVVEESVYQDMYNGLTAVRSKPEAVAVLTGGLSELSIVWIDPRTELRCKARIDYQRPESLTDFKTSRDDGNSPLQESFSYALWTYNYYTQAAWYQYGWEILTGDRLPFWFVVLGTGSPMQCVAAPVGEMTMNLGRDKNIERLAGYSACVESGSFPGYESPVIFELPERYFPSEVN